MSDLVDIYTKEDNLKALIDERTKSITETVYYE